MKKILIKEIYPNSLLYNNKFSREKIKKLEEEINKIAYQLEGLKVEIPKGNFKIYIEKELEKIIDKNVKIYDKNADFKNLINFIINGKGNITLSFTTNTKKRFDTVIQILE